MTRPFFTAVHRPVIKAGVQGPDVVPITDWTISWAEARDALLIAGLAMYAYGILVISPAATIQMETQYGK